MELTKRKQNILASIVNGYIRTGGPVGSKSIAEAAGASPATVRNEMAELTEMGLDVPQPAAIAAALRERGAALPESVYTAQQLHEAVLALLRKGGRD